MLINMEEEEQYPQRKQPMRWQRLRQQDIDGQSASILGAGKHMAKRRGVGWSG